MSSDSATALATQQSIKAYVDSQVGTVDTLAEILANGNTTGGTDIAVSTGDDITFADSSKAIFGAGSDLQIGHDGSVSFITDSGTGDLYIQGSSAIRLTNPAGNETFAVFNDNGAASLYYDNGVSLSTTATGVDITGTLVSDGLTVDTDTLVVDATNNRVGIGTDSPDTLLHLEGADGVPQLKFLRAGTVIGGIIRQTSNPYGLTYDAIDGNAGAPTHVFRTSVDGSTFTERMRIDVSGNVGIGTATAPGSNGKGLAIYTSDYPRLTFRNSTTGDGATNGTQFAAVGANFEIYNKEAGYIEFGTNNTERMRIDSSGNVGIGTTTITSGFKMEVIGDARFGDAVGDDAVELGWSAGGPEGFIQAYDRGASAFRPLNINNSLKVDASGNVGIGTDSPATKVEISGSGFQTLSVTSTTSSPVLKLNSAASNTAFLQWNNAGSSPLSFYDLTASAERMRIDASGNLLVGGTSAYAANATTIATGGIFYVSRNGGSPATLRRNSDDGAILTLERDGTTVGSIGSRGGVVSHIILDPRSGGAGLTAAGASLFPTDNAGTVSDAAIDLGYSVSGTNYRFKDLYLSGGVQLGAGNNISWGGAYGAGIPTISAGAGFFAFYPNGSTSGESMRLDASGDLLVGSSSSPQISAGSVARIEVIAESSSAVAFAPSLPASATGTSIRSQSVTAAGTGWNHFVGSSGNGSSLTTNNIFIYGNGDIGNTNNSYGAISDAKLKENITDATPKLAGINAVRIVNYNLIGHPEVKQLGVIAQELEQIFPGMVSEAPDRDMEGNDLGTVTKSVKYSVFVPMLIKAMQEQQATIEALTARIEALES
jgi:hypothetical protein